MAADYKSAQLTDIDAGTLLDANEYMLDMGDYVTFIGTLTLATQAKSKSVAFVRIPKGYTPARMRRYTDTSLGSSKIAIGYSGSSAAYLAEATFTTTNQPVEGLNVAVVAPTTSEVEVWATNSADASFPASGTFRIEIDAIKP